MSAPVTYGIASVADLLSWTSASDPFFVFNQASVPLVTRNPQPSGALMQLCSGTPIANYPPQGTANNQTYTLRWWQFVDIFTFFGGGTLFYLPSVGWINAAHRNGVPCLATIFVNDSQQVQDLISNQTTAIAQLVAVAQQYGFDGWFFNVEQSLGKTLAGELVTFLQDLTSAIHTAIPSSIIMWYDAVTIEGYVSYQNELNDQNLPFFRACDGIFVNYWWNLDGTPPSPKVSVANAQKAGLSPLGVYSPPNTYGGSPAPAAWGYQSYLAVQNAVNAGTSAALWGPAWTSQNAETPVNGSGYIEGDDEYWGLIGSVFPSRVSAWTFPFVTHFDTGYGHQFCIDGTISSHAWYATWCNVSQQDVLPTWRAALVAGSEAACALRLSHAMPFDGGSCLRITGDPAQGDGSAAYRLYATNLAPGNEALTVSFTFAPSLLGPYWTPAAVYPDLAIALVLDDARAIVLLSGANSPCDGKSVGTDVTPTYLTNGQFTTRSCSGAAGTNVPWNVVTYDLGTDYSGFVIREIRLLAAWTGTNADQPVPFLDWSALGELKLLTGTLPTLSPVTNLAVDGSNLTWTAPSGAAIRHYDVYLQNQDQGWNWIGRAFAPAFYVANGISSGQTYGVACADTSGQFQSTTAMATVTS